MQTAVELVVPIDVGDTSVSVAEDVMRRAFSCREIHGVDSQHEPVLEYVDALIVC